MSYINQIIQGNCKEKLKLLESGSVRCVVTSPPYYALRDYGTAKWVGGDESCNHAGKPMRTKENINKNTGTGEDKKNKEALQFYKSVCEKCGAVRIDEQIGLEETQEVYIANLVEVFEECKRVLAHDGTLWVNIGDSYAAPGKNRTDEQAARKSKLAGSKGTQISCKDQPNKITRSLKPKDLIGIPWILAFALRSAGWYLRQEIIWNKLSVMPESVTDRCTKAHESIFLFSKSLKYYFDYKAIQEPIAASTANDNRYINDDITENKPERGFPGHTSRGGGMLKAKGNRKTFRGGGVYTQGQSFDNSSDVQNNSVGNKPSESDKRNKRSVWSVATAGFAEAHFATYPPKLIVPCILAGSAPGDTVLDPFFGAGTTGIVAQKLGRNFIGIELNPKYIDIADKRLDKELGMFRKRS